MNPYPPGSLRAKTIAIRQKFRHNDEAVAALSGIATVALGVAALVIAAVVALIILAALFPSYSGAVGDLAENMSTADWGDPTANALGPVLAMLIAFGGMFGIVGLAFAAYRLNKGSRGT